MSTSTDGGLTWSAPIATAGHDKGLGGQPVVQPNGTVVVPFESLNGKISAFRSTDGGASWTQGGTIAAHPLPRRRGRPAHEPAADGGDRRRRHVYVAWEDCRFRKSCSSNDIVFSSSSDGVNWSDVARVPIDAVTSGADHFIPGLAVDPPRPARGAHLALTYYFYPDATCTGGCRLQVGYISSPDGGAHWGDADRSSRARCRSTTSRRPRRARWSATTSPPRSPAARATTRVRGRAAAHAAGAFDEAMYAPTRRCRSRPPRRRRGRRAAPGAGPVTGQGTGETHHALKRTDSCGLGRSPATAARARISPIDSSVHSRGSRQRPRGPRRATPRGRAPAGSA